MLCYSNWLNCQRRFTFAIFPSWCMLHGGKNIFTLAHCWLNGWAIHLAESLYWPCCVLNTAPWHSIIEHAKAVCLLKEFRSWNSSLSSVTCISLLIFQVGSVKRIISHIEFIPIIWLWKHWDKKQAVLSLQVPWSDFASPVEVSLLLAMMSIDSQSLVWFHPFSDCLLCYITGMNERWLIFISCVIAGLISVYIFGRQNSVLVTLWF